MLSSNALKYNITVTRSIYGGATVFMLYFLMIASAWFLFDFTFWAVIILLIIAIYGAKKVYLKSYQLILSDCGNIKLLDQNGEVQEGEVSEGSFYNSLFISLQISGKKSLYNPCEKRKKSIVVIYKDSISVADFCFLARFINFGRG